MTGYRQTGPLVADCTSSRRIAVEQQPNVLKFKIKYTDLIWGDKERRHADRSCLFFKTWVAKEKEYEAGEMWA